MSKGSKQKKNRLKGKTLKRYITIKIDIITLDFFFVHSFIQGLSRDTLRDDRLDDEDNDPSSRVFLIYIEIYKSINIYR